MTDNKTEAEKLLQQSKEQKRHETEPTQQSDDEGPTLEAAIADAYQAIDDGDLSSNLTLRDENLAALFHGLESADQLVDVGEAAADSLGRDADGTDTRAAVLRLLVRIGLQNVDESLIESGKQGHRQFIDSQTDEF